MDAKSLLTPALYWALVCGMAFAALPDAAAAKRRDRTQVTDNPRRPSQTLIRPRRMTIGDHNHFMGVLGPGGRYLYYVTDEFNTYDLFIQSPVTAPGEPLFEAFGDIVWPAISPDGRRVLFASGRFGGSDLMTVEIPQWDKLAPVGREGRQRKQGLVLGLVAGGAGAADEHHVLVRAANQGLQVL